jgi:hypothetical protein
VAEEFFVEDPVCGVGADVDVYEGVGEESVSWLVWGGQGRLDWEWEDGLVKGFLGFGLCHCG